jgi:outer membrane usher protein FimD/PapC
MRSRWCSSSRSRPRPSWAHASTSTRGERLQPTPGTGAFFDYDLLVNGGQAVSEQLDGLFEAGLFASGNVLLGNLRVQDAAGDPDVQRLETTLSKDFPDRRATFRFGDSLTVGGAFAQGLRFGGLQWSSNFATDPAFVTFPLPTIGGLAEQDSVVDVIVDNLTRATETVPPDPSRSRTCPWSPAAARSSSGSPTSSAASAWSRRATMSAPAS